MCLSSKTGQKQKLSRNGRASHFENQSHSPLRHARGVQLVHPSVQVRPMLTEIHAKRMGGKVSPTALTPVPRYGLVVPLRREKALPYPEPGSRIFVVRARGIGTAFGPPFRKISFFCRTHPLNLANPRPNSIGSGERQAQSTRPGIDGWVTSFFRSAGGGSDKCRITFVTLPIIECFSVKIRQGWRFFHQSS